MTKEYVIQNLLNRYKEYGITHDKLESIIEEVDGTLAYDVMHLCIRIMLSGMYGTDECFSLDELIMACGSIENVSKEVGVSVNRLKQLNFQESIFSFSKGKRTLISILKNKIICKYKKERWKIWQ